MKIILSLVVFFVCFMPFTECQLSEKSIDSLVVIYGNSQSNEAKIEAGQQLYDEFIFTDRIRAKKYASETFQLSRVSTNPLLKIRGYYIYHQVLNKSADFNEFNSLDTAQQLLEDYYDEIPEKDAKLLQLQIYNSRGSNYYATGEMKNAVSYYLKALELARELEIKSKIASLSYNISICYYAINDYDESIKQLKVTYEYAIANDFFKVSVGALNILGASYQQIDSLQTAKFYIRKAFALSKEGDDEQMKRETLLNMGLISEELNELDSSMYYFNRSLDATVGKEDPLIEAQVYMNMARVESKRNNSTAAIDLFRKATVLNGKVNREELDFMLAIDVAQLDYENGDYKPAYELLQKGYIKKDSFTSIVNRLSIKELELQYGKVDDQREIALQELALTRKERKTTYLTAASIFSLLVTLVLLGLYRGAKKSRKLVEVDLKMKENELQAIKKERSILALSSTLEGQEAERARIAQDLHDGLGGLLSSVKAHYSKIQKEITQLESLDVFDTAEGMLDSACEEVRRISHNLMPPLLRSQGLLPSIQGLLNSYQSDDVEVVLDTRNMEIRLAETKEVFLYRIAQELLVNIEKHAQASKIEVGLYRIENTVQLIIEDNGKGFDVNDYQPGIGLESVRSRVEYLSGELGIESSKEEGTVISVSIPTN